MIKTYSKFPNAIEFEGKTYYKIKGSRGQSQNTNGLISQRYTDDVNGQWNDSCPLYMDANSNIAWD